MANDETLAALERLRRSAETANLAPSCQVAVGIYPHEARAILALIERERAGGERAQPMRVVWRGQVLSSSRPIEGVQDYFEAIAELTDKIVAASTGPRVLSAVRVGNTIIVNVE